MAARPSASILVGPVPFKDLVGDDADNGAAPPDEYDDIVSSLPTSTTIGLRHYHGAWVSEWRVRGVISAQRRFAPRPGDVLLGSPPKCGTTWLKALSFAVMARDAYPPAGAGHPLRRLNPHDCVPFMDELFSSGQQAKLDALPSPRLMNTHMHHSLLPASVADNPDCKIVYVCREPKDMVVSMWHFLRGVWRFTFAELFEWACEGKTPNGPVWEHILGYWRASRAAPERVLFLRYEEMLADPAGHVRGLARFLGRPFSAADEAVGLPASVVELCSFEALRGVSARSAGSCSGSRVEFTHQSYFRKGAVGDWANHMTTDMARRFDAIVEDKLHGSGLAFN
ncbi:flavonol 3-sulfotransferase-like [Aegilops tauschii subsp. strangulata]|uniref:Sulfotransferase n=1 Tax=Aegilops tauschii subsp. strangulata TaxID=200361 RepID=A0A452XL10_AEGTS|nr:flavonol 3-sulfotransferase-like [Aegilops tauschii subsp. strangulata]